MHRAHTTNALEGLLREGGRRPRPGPVLVLAAHPDDETLCAGGHLPALPGVHVALLTDGAPVAPGPPDLRWDPERLAYAARRRAEAVSALALAGIGEDRLHLLGAVDQQACRALPGLARRLAELLGRLRPSVLLTHAYEGGHPDHDAAAFVAHAARALLAARGVAPPPQLEMAAYHLAGDEVVRGAFPRRADVPEREVRLSAAARDLKARMIDRYASQRAVTSGWPIGVERFRVAPRYDFGAPPGPVLYEREGWGPPGRIWRTLAAQAGEVLGLGRAPTPRGAPWR